MCKVRPVVGNGLWKTSRRLPGRHRWFLPISPLPHWRRSLKKCHPPHLPTHLPNHFQTHHPLTSLSSPSLEDPIGLPDSLRISPTIQSCNSFRMFVNKRFGFSTAHHKNQYSHQAFSIFAVNLLVKINGESIIVVATVRVVRVAELPVHVTHLFLQRDCLPTSNDGDSGFVGSCCFVEILQSCGGCQPT